MLNGNDKQRKLPADKMKPKCAKNLRRSYGPDCSRQTEEYEHFHCDHSVQQDAAPKTPPEQVRQ